MIKSVAQLLSASADSMGETAAIYYEDESWSYRQLDDMARRVAGGLISLGLREGDRVAFWLPNCVAYIVMYFACVRLGLIVVAINTRFRALDVGDLLQRSRAKALLFWPGFRGIDFSRILADIEMDDLKSLTDIIVFPQIQRSLVLPSNLRRLSVTSYQQLLQHRPLKVDCATDDAGCCTFTTSGTTSRPKLVLHGQHSVAIHAGNVASQLSPMVGTGSVLQVLPFCGVFGFVTMIGAVAGGLKMVIVNHFDAAEVVDLVDRYQVRYFNTSDDMLFALLNADQRSRALPSLVTCGYAAFNTTPREVDRRAKERGVQVIGVYGMSEVMALFSMHALSEHDETRYLGGGRLISDAARVRVRDVDSGELHGLLTVGELELSGPSLMQCYLDDEQATTDAFTDDGFFRTGDLGYTISADTFVYQTRMGDSLRLAGYLVNPVEIESHLCRLSGVKAAQVVAVKVGDTTRAFAFVIATSGNISKGSLMAHCDGALATFKVPVGFQLLECFPITKGANGTKIQRSKLREMAQLTIERARD